MYIIYIIFNSTKIPDVKMHKFLSKILARRANLQKMGCKQDNPVLYYPYERKRYRKRYRDDNLHFRCYMPEAIMGVWFPFIENVDQQRKGEVKKL